MKAVYETARSNLETELKGIDAKLATFPKGPMGLTIDSVKETAEWKSLKASRNRVFDGIRKINGALAKLK